MGGVIFIRRAEDVSVSAKRILKTRTDSCLSGNHCVVKVGHSSAVLSIRSYRKGEFFFHILYSSFISFCSITSSSRSSSILSCMRIRTKPSLSQEAPILTPAIMLFAIFHLKKL